MFDKKKTKNKAFAVGIISLIFLVLLGLYNRNADRINYISAEIIYKLSITKEIATLRVKSQYKKAAQQAPTKTNISETWNGVPVFVYHGITNQADRFSMTFETFKNQMFLLKMNGYQTITIEQFNDFINHGTPVPSKSFLLTFDDGRSDSFIGADPVLRALNYTAVMFVAIESSMPDSGHKNTYYISTNDIQHMVNSKRWEIGSHAIQETGGFVPIDASGTEGNFLSNYKWLAGSNRLETDEEYKARVDKEVGESKKELESLFGTKVIALSYPFGDYGQQSVNNDGAQSVIHDGVASNYDVAFRQVWPEDGEFIFNRPGDESYHLKRFETPTDWTGSQLVEFLEDNQDKSIPFVDTFESDQGWLNTWGNSRIDTNGGMVMEATDTSTGAASFLEGTENWENYEFTATLDWTVGSHISLMAQYQDSKNYLVCTFGQGRAKIEKVQDGKIEKLIDVKTRRGYSQSGTFGIKTSDNSVQCSVNGVTVVWAQTESEKGGVGLRIWDQELNLAAIHVSAVEVVPVDQK